MSSSETGIMNSWASGSLWDMTGRMHVVTFIGAGGKTTCLRSLTREIVAAGQRVIATTTTKVFPEEAMKGWKNPSPPSCEQAGDEQEGACFWYADVEDKSGKWIGPPVEAVDVAIATAKTDPNLRECKSENRPQLAPSPTCTYWVIEGDGAKGLRLKCWEPHEPQIPQRSDCAVLVLEGGLWGNVLQAEDVHRPQECLELLGHVWNAEAAWRYFLRSPVFAPQYGKMSWVILLNWHGENAGNEDLLGLSGPLEPLLDLKRRWTEIQRELKSLEYRPNHLRIAEGDAKEGRLQWFDLW